jgi:hypothetical protein
MDDSGHNGKVPPVHGATIMNSPQVFDPVEAQFQSTLLQDLKRTASQQTQPEPPGILQRLLTGLRARVGSKRSARS